MATCATCGSSYAAHVRLCPKDGGILEGAERSPDPALGRTLDGKYRIEARLGEGGMGAVYRATHLMLGKPVAVKLITPALVASTDAVRRFQREARAASALSHPHIAIAHDFGQAEDGTLYMVMEFVDGPTLKTVIRDSRPAMPAERIIHILRQVAAALAFAHEQQVVHRDLKPQNILVARDSQGRDVAKLADFGIAKTVDADATQLTATGNVVGTPQYMSPEQIKGSPIDGRSDIYSLGIIAYEMVVGEVPFNDPSTPQVLLRHLQEPPARPSLRSVGRAIPPALEAIVLKCLEKDADARFAHAGLLVEALDAARLSLSGTEEKTIVLGATTPSAPLPATVLDTPAPVTPAAAGAAATPAVGVTVERTRRPIARRLAVAAGLFGTVLLLAHPATWLFREYVDPPYLDDFSCGSRGVFVAGPGRVVALGCSSARRAWFRGGGEDYTAQLWSSADAARTWRTLDFPDQAVGGAREWNPGLLGNAAGSRLIARGATDLFALDPEGGRWLRLGFDEGTFDTHQVTSIGDVPFALTPKGWFVRDPGGWSPRGRSGGRLLATAALGSGREPAMFTSAGELSLDGGRTWQDHLAGLPREGHIRSAAMTLDGHTLTVLAIWDAAEEFGESSTGQLFRREFDPSAAQPRPTGEWTAIASPGGHQAVMHGVAAGAAPGLVWAAGDMVILASQNAGRTWTEVWNARHRYSLHRIVGDPGDARTAYAGIPGGLLVTRDMGTTWTCSQYVAHGCASFQAFANPR